MRKVWQVGTVFGLVAVVFAVLAPSAGAATGTFEVAASSDDAEEKAGRVNLASSDLELIDDSGQQTVGMRFTNVAIPEGSTITNAYVQFQADRSSSNAVTVDVLAQAADHPATFTTAPGDISSRATTSSSVAWAIPAWSAGQRGAAQRTPNLAGVVQEVVNRSRWTSGNASRGDRRRERHERSHG